MDSSNSQNETRQSQPPRPQEHLLHFALWRSVLRVFLRYASLSLGRLARFVVLPPSLRGTMRTAMWPNNGRDDCMLAVALGLI